jgi:hypothetical protein
MTADGAYEALRIAWFGLLSVLCVCAAVYAVAATVSALFNDWSLLANRKARK